MTNEQHAHHLLDIAETFRTFKGQGYTHLNAVGVTQARIDALLAGAAALRAPQGETCDKALAAQIEAAYKLGRDMVTRAEIDANLIRKAVTAGLKAFRSQHGSTLTGSNLSSAAKRISGEVLAAIPKLTHGHPLPLPPVSPAEPTTTDDQSRSDQSGEATADPRADDRAVCQLCGQPMPPGEEMFNYHGYSGPCPTAPNRPAEPRQE